MNKDNLAYQMSLRSRECVHSHDKQGWLDMFAEDGVIEDPIGESALDPSGNGHRTPAEREAFWDQTIAQSDIRITILESHTAARECANRLRLDIEMDIGGQRHRQRVDGIFTYRIDAAGKLAALRGYWEFGEGMASLQPVGDAAGEAA